MASVATNPQMKFRIIGIELLNSYINFDSTIDYSKIAFNFNINLECKINRNQKLTYIIAGVEVLRDSNLLLGSIKVSCIYEIENFDEVMILNENEQVSLAKHPQEILNLLTLSTTRGMMFQTFKGTFLHGAILPIIDPHALIKMQSTL